ncbi:MAG: bifunctional DNA primase/polymerase [Actinomycetota bacterium]
MTRRDQRQRLLDTALAYAEGGWPVFPLRPGAKRPAAPNHTAATCDGSDRFCADGHSGWERRATTDADRITTAWRHRPYGIAIATGPAGLLVVDLDPAKDDEPSGAQTLAELEERNGQHLPPTWTVATPRGGRHLYYRCPAVTRLGNTCGRLGPGIDTRAVGGYVVAPPTVTTGPDGGEYWLVDDHPPADLPHWFSQLLTTPRRRVQTTGRRKGGPSPSIPQTDRVRRYVARAVAGEQLRITTAPTGQRNHSLFCASVALGQLVGADILDLADAEHQLLTAAQAHVLVGAYSQSQARATILSGLRRGTSEPRELPASLMPGAA